MSDSYGDINQPDAPNPYERIARFSSAEDLKNHYQQAHERYRDSKFCTETDCLHKRGHHASNSIEYVDYNHGDNIFGYKGRNGKFCDRSFQYKKQLEEHKRIIHCKIESKTRKEIFELCRTLARVKQVLGLRSKDGLGIRNLKL